MAHYSSFYALLIEKMSECDSTKSAVSNNMRKNLQLLRGFNDTTKNELATKLAKPDIISIIKSSNWQEAADDKIFLKLNQHNHYRKFFWTYFSDFMLTPNGIDFLAVIVETTLELTDDELQQKEEFNLDYQTEDPELDVEPGKTSFCWYLAEAIKIALFNDSEVPVTVRGLKGWIVSLGAPEQEKNRVAVIRKLKEIYDERTAELQSINNNSNDNSDTSFLKMMECQNFMFFLNNYLPLSPDDDIHPGFYTLIGMNYPPKSYVKNNLVSKIVATISTRPTQDKKIQLPLNNFTSLYQELKIIANDIKPQSVTDMDDVIDILPSLTLQEQQVFLKNLRKVWREKISSFAGFFNQEEDAKFLRTAHYTNYTFFFKVFFPEANELDNYLFVQIGVNAVSITLTTSPHNITQTSYGNLTLVNQKPLISQTSTINNIGVPIKAGATFFEHAATGVKKLGGSGKLVKQVQNRINDRRTPEERYARFDIDKSGIAKKVRKAIFARILGNEPQEQLSLTSTGAHIVVEGVKKILGYMFTPIKVGFKVNKIANKAINYSDKKKLAETYDNFYTDITDQECNKAIENVLNRVGLTMKKHFEQLSDTDYASVRRYIINKMVLAFDGMNYSLMDNKNPLSIEWEKYTPAQKRREVEKMLFYFIFVPLPDVHHDEKITIDSEAYSLEALMAQIPLEFDNGKCLQLRENLEQPGQYYQIYRYQGPYLDGHAYQAGISGKDFSYDRNEVLTLNKMF